MGILAKGIPYSPPDNFEDDKTKALKEFIEKQKSQKTKLAELMEQAKSMAFDNWYMGLEEHERKQILPSIFQKANGFTKLSWFRGHFDKEIWPKSGLGSSLELSYPVG